jgi:hypothetical protein
MTRVTQQMDLRLYLDVHHLVRIPAPLCYQGATTEYFFNISRKIPSSAKGLWCSPFRIFKQARKRTLPEFFPSQRLVTPGLPFKYTLPTFRNTYLLRADRIVEPLLLRRFVSNDLSLWRMTWRTRSTILLNHNVSIIVGLLYYRRLTSDFVATPIRPDWLSSMSALSLGIDGDWLENDVLASRFETNETHAQR